MKNTCNTYETTGNQLTTVSSGNDIMIHSSMALPHTTRPSSMKPTLISNGLTKDPVHCSTAAVTIADVLTLGNCGRSGPCSVIHVHV